MKTLNFSVIWCEKKSSRPNLDKREITFRRRFDFVCGRTNSLGGLRLLPSGRGARLRLRGLRRRSRHRRRFSRYRWLGGDWSGL